jgi:anti-anti-sigma factor
MATPLSIGTRIGGDGTVVLAVTGELDMSNVDVFSTAITDAMAPASQDGGVLTIDLTGVEYLDSAAINALFEHADRTRLVANPILMPVLRVSGLTSMTAVESG